MSGEPLMERERLAKLQAALDAWGEFASGFDFNVLPWNPEHHDFDLWEGYVLEGARQIFEQHGGMPLMLLMRGHDSDGESAILTMRMRKEGNRHAAEEQMRSMASLYHADRLVLLIEGELEAPGGARRDMIMALFENAAGAGPRAAAWVAPIQPDVTRLEQPRVLGDWEVMPAVRLQGMHGSLLQERSTLSHGARKWRSRSKKRGNR